jgi:hypothetical protein
MIQFFLRFLYGAVLFEILVLYYVICGFKQSMCVIYVNVMYNSKFSDDDILMIMMKV